MSHNRYTDYPYPVSKKVIDAIERFDVSSLSKNSALSSDTLLSAMANVLGLLPENIIATNEPVFHVLNVFAKKNSMLILASPYYSQYERIAKMLRINYRIISAEYDFTIDLGKIPNKQKTILLLSNPNTQTGIFINIAILDAFLSSFLGICIIDEAYIEFASSSAANILYKHNNLFILRCMDHAYGLPAIKVAFIISCKKNIYQIYSRENLDNLTALSQIIATAALSNSDYMLENSMKTILERDRVKSNLIKLGFIVLPSSTNFLAVKWDIVASNILFLYLLENNARVFRFEDIALSEWIGINIGNKKDNNLLLSHVRSFLNVHMQRS